ncbi:hypothetical protein L6164_000788 [Bauhinia variegata]|uniref:Uncharacterized protein n=1 Tax=Bauhinia variegata TaxID=167791 RepID=A0ACB9Q7J2_BAUVA|nr:hypothetical protein L6164_000788 [Bauhinia variegata]
MEEGKGRVCVTGATGFVASSIIKTLLEDGYSVNATVRFHPENKKDLDFLSNLPAASQKLQIFNADLSSPESFSAAIEGCVGDFHVATPVDLEVREPKEVVTKRSIDGAMGILRASLNSNTVKRLALTEKAVLEFGEENGLDVVTVVLPCVVGPFICPKLPHSVALTLAFLFGDNYQHGLLFRTPLVHVDDVTNAYIFLLEHPNLKGRYNVSSSVVTIEEIRQLLSVKYPEYQIPNIDFIVICPSVKGGCLCNKICNLYIEAVIYLSRSKSYNNQHVVLERN